MAYFWVQAVSFRECKLFQKCLPACRILPQHHSIAGLFQADLQLQVEDELLR